MRRTSWRARWEAGCSSGSAFTKRLLTKLVLARLRLPKAMKLVRLSCGSLQRPNGRTRIEPAGSSISGERTRGETVTSSSSSSCWKWGNCSISHSFIHPFVKLQLREEEKEFTGRKSKAHPLAGLIPWLVSGGSHSSIIRSSPQPSPLSCSCIESKQSWARHPWPETVSAKKKIILAHNQPAKQMATNTENDVISLFSR